MNTYDLTVVFDGKLTAAKKKTAIEKLEKLVTVFNGKTGKVVDWGEKKLAYPIKKSVTGLYLTFPLEMLGEDAKKFHDKLRLEEGILRYLLIRSEENKKAAKAKNKKAKSEEVVAE